MRMPMRSLTEPPGFRNSHLASSSQPVSRPMRRRRTIGVLPIASRIESRILVKGRSAFVDLQAGEDAAF